MDLPHHVKRGLLKIKENRDEINRILKHKGDILRFYYDEADGFETESFFNQEGDYFYTMIEKSQRLKNTGMADDEINELLNIDIDSYFKNTWGICQPNLKEKNSWVSSMSLSLKWLQKYLPMQKINWTGFMTTKYILALPYT